MNYKPCLVLFSNINIFYVKKSFLILYNVITYIYFLKNLLSVFFNFSQINQFKLQNKKTSFSIYLSA